MRRLTVLTLAWRNYLYANHDGLRNDPEDLLSRVSLIQDEKEAIFNEILKDEPDLNEIRMSIEEIDYQIKNLEDMAKEFSQFSECYRFHETPEVLQRMVLDDLLSNGMESELYIIAKEWKEYAVNAKKVIQEMPDCSAFDIKQENYLMEQLMELQDPEGERNFQQVKKQIEQLQLENAGR